jgi:hypothetical protein
MGHKWHKLKSLSKLTFLKIGDVEKSAEIQTIHSDWSHEQVTLHKIFTTDSKNLGHKHGVEILCCQVQELL